jgi:hypothetical protein
MNPSQELWAVADRTYVHGIGSMPVESRRVTGNNRTLKCELIQETGLSSTYLQPDASRLIQCVAGLALKTSKNEK